MCGAADRRVPRDSTKLHRRKLRAVCEVAQQHIGHDEVLGESTAAGAALALCAVRPSL